MKKMILKQFETISDHVVYGWLNLIFIPMTTKFQFHGSDANIPDYLKASLFQMPQQFLRERGWAKRLKQGQMYGKKYMNESSHTNQSVNIFLN